MNDIEAIQRIKDHIEVHKIGEYPHIKIGEALNLAMQALEKQIPKKPIFKDSIASHYHCPTCMRLYWDRWDSNECCDLCGQRLDWSGEDE